MHDYININSFINRTYCKFNNNYWTYIDNRMGIYYTTRD